MFFKTLFLVLAFFLVIFTMQNLRDNGLDRATLALFGLNQQEGPDKLFWCDMRVKSLENPSGGKLIQEGYSWFWEGEKRKELDFIAVEKWFTKYCSVPIEPKIPPHAENLFKPTFKVQFIKGPPEFLEQTNTGLFRWRGMVFASKAMEKALKDLKNFAPMQATR